MPRRFVTLAWIAAACTYLLIVVGALVRITQSGLGCGEDWPLCNGHLFPPLNDPHAVIEWTHRQLAGLVSILVAALAVYAWRLGEGAGSGEQGARRSAYVAVALLAVQVSLGAVTVKTGLTPAIVILHLATAMLLLAALLVAAHARPAAMTVGSVVVLGLTFVTVLLGALTANLGAMASCGGFPLCNGQIIPTAGPLAAIHWTHRLLAYTLLGTLIWWLVRKRASWGLLGIVALQIAIAATMIQLGFPGGLQTAHAAVGAGVWATMVLATLRPATDPAAGPAASPRGPNLPDRR